MKKKYYFWLIKNRIHKWSWWWFIEKFRHFCKINSPIVKCEEEAPWCLLQNENSSHKKSPGAKLFLPTYLLCQSTYSSTFSTSSFIIKGKTAEVNWILPDHPGRFLQWKKNSICRTMSCHLFPSNSYFYVIQDCIAFEMKHYNLYLRNLNLPPRSMYMFLTYLVKIVLVFESFEFM